MLIGKGGSGLREMQDKTGVKVGWCATVASVKNAALMCRKAFQ